MPRPIPVFFPPPCLPNAARALVLAALLLVLAGCGVREEAPPPFVEPALAATAPPEPLFAEPRYWGEGELISSEEVGELDLKLLGAESYPNGRLTVHLGLYNNAQQELRLDARALLEQARLGNARVEAVELEQGNTERLIPHSGLVAHLRFVLPAAEERLSLQVPTFPALPVDLSAPPLAAPPTVAPLPDGLWRVDEPVVASREVPDVGMQVVDLRVRGQTMIVTLGFINLQERILTGGESTLSGQDVRLVDAQGIAYAPIEVEGTLAESILPPGEWYPGERHTGELRFPRPTSGPVRLEVPTFPPLRLAPAQAEPVTLATAEDFPPSDGPPIALEAPPDLPNATLATPVSYEAVGAFLSEVGEQLAAGEREAFLANFAGEARGQMEAWWPGMAQLGIAASEFELRRGGAARGALVTGADYLFFYRLVGDAPENRFMLPVSLDLLREGERWQITRWESDTPLWAGEWARTESPHFLILADPALAEETALLIAEAETALEALLGALSALEPRERYVMLVPASAERFRQLTERGHETQGLASFRNLISRSGIETNSLSFVLNGAALGDSPREQRRRTIAHELVHLLLAPSTRPYTPAWLTEGTATFFSEGVPWETLRPWIARDGLDAFSLRELTTLEQFTDWSDPRTVPEQYALSAALIAFLVEQYGQDRFLAFYQDYGSAEHTERFREALQASDAEAALRDLRIAFTEELLQQHVEQTIATLDSAFRPWLLRRAASGS